ncbi:MAG TPA: efflux RND transporter permease subunit [Spirochaetota bacterium]|nr:efflux RND transporter permease subunit [Spirochaetota bacterium]HPV40921.1 efflux RND transporter permease subunit [Spirochaetota bacterium]
MDNSVVITEHFARLRETGLPGREAAVASAKQFAAPFIASTITIISAFLPMVVTRGVMGQFIRWIQIVVMIALTFALIESLTLLPARLQFFGRRGAQPATAAGARAQACSASSRKGSPNSSAIRSVKGGPSTSC